jgi:hypothetical protein
VAAILAARNPLPNRLTPLHGLTSRAAAGEHLQHFLKLKFDFYDSLLPVLMLDDFVFPVVLVLKILAILDSYLLQFVAE